MKRRRTEAHSGNPSFQAPVPVAVAYTATIHVELLLVFGVAGMHIKISYSDVGLPLLGLRVAGFRRLPVGLIGLLGASCEGSWSSRASKAVPGVSVRGLEGGMKVGRMKDPL